MTSRVADDSSTQLGVPGILGLVIGRLEKTVIDCPDPRSLAAFYCEVLGMRANEDVDGDWVVIGAG